MLPRRTVCSAAILSSAVLAASFVPTARAQQTAAATQTTAAPAASQQAQPALKSLADDFLHYSIVGNNPLAVANGQAILQSKASPADVLQAFEAVAGNRDVDSILERNQRTPALKDVSAQLTDVLAEGHRAVARDPERIKAEIKSLAESPRAYDLGLERLRAAGGYAVPYYIEVLKDQNQQTLQPYVERVMTQVGRPLVPALVAGLDTDSTALKVTLINTLGQIGYAQALPELMAIAAQADAPATVRQAAANAIARIDTQNLLANISPATAFLNMGKNYLNHVPGYQPLHPDEKTNPVWLYDSSLGNVVSVAVPTPIYNDIKAQHCAEQALRLDSKLGSAISLWLAADMKSEIDLPAGATNPLHPKDGNPAMYYASAAGPLYLTPVLDMALNDHASELALHTIKALELTANAQALVSGEDSKNPLVQALGYPDRAVRFGAAFALARAQPDKPFAGAYRVVPVLAEAVGQTGQPVALVAEQDEATRNRIAGELRKLGYTVAAADTLSNAVTNAQNSQALDLIVVGSDTQPQQIAQLGKTDYRFAAASVVVTAPVAQLPGVQSDLEQQKLGYQVVQTDAAGDALKAAIDQATSRSTLVKVTPESATQYALTAIDLLGDIGKNRASIYNVHDAIPALIGALRNTNKDVVTAAGNVLGSLNDKSAQQALAKAALADRDNGDVTKSLLLALAASARQTGNALQADQVHQLMKVVETAKDPAARTAAAAALGALNLPSNKASELILRQAK